jgi:hypothetical protein
MRIDEVETDGCGLGFGLDAIELLSEIIEKAEGLGF